MTRGMLIVVTLLGLTLATAAAPTFVVTDETAGRTMLCRPFPAPTRVTLAFTHSMYGGEVRETYTVADGSRLRRVALTTANAAAAEYYAYVADVVRDGTRFRVDLPAAEFDEIVVRVDRVGDHRLMVAGVEIDLVAAAGDRHQVRLDVRSSTLAERLLGRGCREGAA